jgi:cell division protein FtsI/penicillin-binding protein 2
MMAQVSRKRRLEAIFNRRRRLLVVVALCVWGAIWARAAQLQLINRTTFTEASQRQSDRWVCLVAPRGDIVDRRGRLLALNLGTESFFAYPGRESSARLLAQRFAPYAGKNRLRLARQWDQRNDRFTWMVRRCDATTARLIRSWNLPGVHSMGEYKRVYPCAIPQVADPVGFVNDALEGAAGVELAYSDVLAGEDGKGYIVRDATGRRFDLDPVPVKPLRAGARLHLTLDWGWQSILSEELVNAVEKWRALSGMALLMDPHTGAILAMADYNPAGNGRRTCKNRLVSDVFEPGSTYKLVTFAGALSDGAVKLNDYFDGENGKGLFAGHLLRDDKAHGIMSAAEVFVLSSNVGTGRIANRLAPGRLEFWSRRFGFSQPTGIDLLGESPGRLARQIHSEFNTATLAIGHGVAVTPVQLAAAYAVIANGGYLVRPHLVAAIEDARGDVERIPVQGERVLRPDVAFLMTRLMARVVSEGTATKIWDPEFPIAGKTGTAEKPNPATGYDKNKFIASFVGFYPAHKPRILGLVILNEPQGIHYGGYTAAPVLLNTIRRGAACSFDRDNEPAKYAADVRAQEDAGDWTRHIVQIVAPLVSVSEARAERQGGLGDCIVVPDRIHDDEATGFKGAWLTLAEDESDHAEVSAALRSGQWPDLRGKNLRDALALLRSLNAQWTIAGSGLVVKQSPPPDTPLDETRICQLTLR